MELLASEAMEAVERNETLEAVNAKIKQFLSEDSIIERTQNCTSYFEDFVAPYGAMAEVLYCQ